MDKIWDGDIEATIVDGVLKITLPKAEKSRKKWEPADHMNKYVALQDE